MIYYINTIFFSKSSLTVDKGLHQSITPSPSNRFTKMILDYFQT